jgi:3-oxoacyl-[acyl-carrier protein] reductase
MIFGNFDFKDKNIFVTGAGGGIGKSLVTELLNKGANVWAADLMLDSLSSLGSPPNLTPVELDVRNQTSWESGLREFREGKRLDGLVQCAGVLKPGYIADIETRDIDFHIDINVKGLLLGATLVSRIMKRQKSGHIVNIASLAGVAPIPGIALYSTSKFAVRGFTLALAQELKEFQVSVTVICPDAVQTPMLDLQVGHEETALTFSGVQLTPEEVTNSILSSFQTKELEILMPMYRGLLGKIGNSFPGLSSLLYEALKKKGLKKQEEFKK